MHLHMRTSWEIKGTQLCSSWRYRPPRLTPRRQQQAAPVASVKDNARAWGMGWARKKGQANVKKPRDHSTQQEPGHQQLIQQQQQPPAPGVQVLKQLTTDDYPAVYDAIANSIHQEFLKHNIFACCQPASLLFYEAVKQVNPSADPQFVLGYVVVPQPTPGGPDICARHMWVQLGGKQYDIGQTVAVAMLQKQYGRKVPIPQYGLERPPDAAYVGWDMGALSRQVKPCVTTAAQDAAMIEQFESAAGRELYWSGSPPQLIGVRRDILMRNWV